MEDRQFEHWEVFLNGIADKFPYPSTPDIRSKIQDVESIINNKRRHQRNQFLLKAVILISILLMIFMSVPTVRAAVIDFIQFGIVRIFQRQPLSTQNVSNHDAPNTQIESTPPVGYTLIDLAGVTSLEEAQSNINFQILIPSYPPDLGKPDRVIVQTDLGEAIILIWFEDRDDEYLKIALMEFGRGASIGKDVSRDVNDANVNGLPAIWIDEPHTMWINAKLDDRKDIPISIDGNVLIWEDGYITYRLETQTTLDEAVKIAESLIPLP